MNKGKTNNTYLKLKQYLRSYFTANLNEINVLDCFCGKSEVWQGIPYTKYIGIDKEKTEKINYHGDNRKWLEVLDLSKFNVIDLDSYGIPYSQLQIIFANKTLKKDTIIFFTFIQSGMGMMPKGLLCKCGYTKEMIKKIPTLFNRNGFHKFKEYLAGYGITEVSYIQIDRKVYGKFCIDTIKKK